MRCPENCSCILCLELNGCEKRLERSSGDVKLSDNFILAKPDGIKAKEEDGKTYTFFGMEDCGSRFENRKNTILNKEKGDFEKIKMMTLDKVKETSNTKENVSLHKSIIYVDDSVSKIDGNERNSNVILNEILDESTCLDTVQDSNIINVIFRNTYSFATQVINDVQFPECCLSDVNSDDFPLGIEANLYNKILAQRYNKQYEKSISVNHSKSSPWYNLTFKRKW